MIKTLSEVNTNCAEGRLLMAALAKLTTESQTDKTPDDVIQQCADLANDMYKDASPLQETATYIRFSFTKEPDGLLDMDTMEGGDNAPDSPEAKEVIELSELKIGNYLLYKGEVVHVTSLSLDIDDEYEDMIGFCKLGEISNEVAAWNRSLYNDLDRIPLTEDWIIKFGLHFNYGYDFAGKFNLYIEHGAPICRVCLEQYSEGRELLPGIKYVHQFQVLFAALTGKELKAIL